MPLLFASHGCMLSGVLLGGSFSSSLSWLHVMLRALKHGVPISRQAQHFGALHVKFNGGCGSLKHGASGFLGRRSTLSKRAWRADFKAQHLGACESNVMTVAALWSTE